MILLVFGPDMLMRSTQIPALKRVAMLFPGWSRNPYHNEQHRREVLDTVDAYYDLAFVNPGPLEEAYKACEDSVRKWVFKPYLILGEPVEVEAKLLCSNN